LKELAIEMSSLNYGWLERAFFHVLTHALEDLVMKKL
jgi:hypothetical protein